MPKFMLRRFENKDNRFFYYDVSKKIPGTNGHARSINTQVGYYSEDTEEYLNENVETPLSRIISIVDNINFDDPEIILDEDVLHTIRVYFYSLIARNPLILKTMNDNSIFYQFFTEQEQHDMAAVSGINLAEQADILGDWVITFCVNKTETPFILPVCGCYEIRYSGIHAMMLPVSPYVQIVFIEPKGIEHIIHNGIISLLLVEEATIVHKLNMFALKAQVNNKWGYVVSPERNVLEKAMSDSKTFIGE